MSNSKKMSAGYDNKYASYYVGSHHILITIKTSITLDIDVVDQISSDRMSLQDGKLFSAVLDIRQLEDSTKQGRDYLGRYGWFFCDRVGILAKEHKSMHIAKFYLHFSKPSIPTIIFLRESDALSFLYSKE